MRLDLPAAARALGAVGQDQPLASPRHADVRQPTLLLDAVLGDRPAVGQDALLEPDQVDRAELQALGRVQGHQANHVAAVLLVLGVAAVVEGQLVEEAPQ